MADHQMLTVQIVHNNMWLTANSTTWLTVRYGRGWILLVVLVSSPVKQKIVVFQLGGTLA